MRRSNETVTSTLAAGRLQGTAWQECEYICPFPLRNFLALSTNLREESHSQLGLSRLDEYSPYRDNESNYF